MLTSLRGDGAVQNPVNKAGDGGHGGFQLMGYVRYKLLPLVFAFLQGGSHIVKGQSQILHLLGAAGVYLHTGIQIAVAEIMGGLGQILQGLTLIPGKQ